MGISLTGKSSQKRKAKQSGEQLVAYSREAIEDQKATFNSIRDSLKQYQKLGPEYISKLQSATLPDLTNMIRNTNEVIMGAGMDLRKGFLDPRKVSPNLDPKMMETTYGGVRDPDAVMQSPMFQGMFDEVQRRTEQSLASRGKAGSGQFSEDLAMRMAPMASQFASDQLSRDIQRTGQQFGQEATARGMYVDELGREFGQEMGSRQQLVGELLNRYEQEQSNVALIDQLFGRGIQRMQSPQQQRFQQLLSMAGIGLDARDKMIQTRGAAGGNIANIKLGMGSGMANSLVAQGAADASKGKMITDALMQGGMAVMSGGASLPFSGLFSGGGQPQNVPSGSMSIAPGGGSVLNQYATNPSYY